MAAAGRGSPPSPVQLLSTDRSVDGKTNSDYLFFVWLGLGVRDQLFALLLGRARSSFDL